VQRLTLGAGVFTAIRPPATFAQVSIGNGTLDDLQVHTNEDQTEYLIIASGFERNVPVDRPAMMSPPDVAFWLKAVQSGTVVLLWT